jgi:putative ABC transport system permease protein
MTLTRNGHLNDNSFFTERIMPEGADTSDARAIAIRYDVISPRYFRIMGIRLLAGREFNEGDRSGAPATVIVNATLAALYWPGEDAIGRRLQLGQVSREVVGVAPDRPWRSGRQPFLYLPLFQDPPWWSSGTTVVLRTLGPPAASLAELRRRVASLDPNIPLIQPRTVGEEVHSSLGYERLFGAVVAVAATLALGLAMTGLFATMGHAVARRRREFGVRLALGARASQLYASILAEGVGHGLLGLTLGLLGSLAANRLLVGLLYGVSPLDPTVLVLTAASLLALVVMVSQLPARRATRADPIEALRAE